MLIHPAQRNGGGDQVNKCPKVCWKSTGTIRPADVISRRRYNGRRSETETRR